MIDSLLSFPVLHELSPQAKHTLSNPYNIHAAVMAAFPREQVGRVLWRADMGSSKKNTVITVRCPIEPCWDRMVEAGASVANVGATFSHLRDGQEYDFVLRANPCITRAGRRIPIAGDTALSQWMVAQAGKIGADINARQLQVTVEPAWSKRTSHGEKNITIQTVDFEGLLKVTDAEAFKAGLFAGIGKAKGFGCGLLWIMPPYNNQERQPCTS
jgi:CRISPR system Cascade subunit CasE